MNAYRETLHRWAAQHVPDGAEVVEVEVIYDDGWDPTFTDRPESLTVSIGYQMAGYTFYSRPGVEVLTSVGELLTALFAIEEQP